MAEEVQFKVMRHSDKFVFQVLRDIAAEMGAGDVAIDIYPMSTPNAALIGENRDPDKKDAQTKREEEFLNFNTIAARKLRAKVAGVEIFVERRTENGKANQPLEYCDVAIMGGGGQEDPMLRARLFSAMRSKLTAIDERSYRDAVDEVSRSLFESREKEIGELKDVVLELTRKLADYTVEQENTLKARLKEVDDAAIEQREEIKALADARQAELDAEQKRVEERAVEIEGKLSERETELDKLRNESSRRSLRLEMHGQLKDWSEKFGLTWGTYRKATAVFVVYAFLLGTFAFAAYSAFENLASAATDIRYALPIYGPWVAFAVTATFFVRWMNQLYRAHADEEFRLKRTQLDIERASWVYEMAREWEHDSEGKPMPQFLVERLTRDLFENPNTEPVATSAGDVLISKGLFGRWKVIRVKKDGVEFEAADTNGKAKAKGKQSDDEE